MGTYKITSVGLAVVDNGFPWLNMCWNNHASFWFVLWRDFQRKLFFYTRILFLQCYESRAIFSLFQIVVFVSLYLI